LQEILHNLDVRYKWKKMKLYKFMKVDENGYIIDALENSYLFFQTPYLFDDPEDCDIKFNYNGVNYKQIKNENDF